MGLVFVCTMAAIIGVFAGAVFPREITHSWKFILYSLFCVIQGSIMTFKWKDRERRKIRNGIIKLCKELQNLDRMDRHIEQK